MNPRVSVISIFFNAADYFAEAIESVLAQDYRDFELLLVDDGSIDRSTEIAQAYVRKDPSRIRYLQHPGHANRGMSATRNLGLKEARGELVAFIDADDHWRPAKLREQVALFDSNPRTDALFGTVNYWRSWNGGSDTLVRTGHAQDRAIEPPEASTALYPLGRGAAPCPSDLMVRRSVALALGGFEESFTGARQMYEDQAFFAKLYLQNVVYFADAYWLDYRRHDRSCVAEVSREGRYDEVRRYFLEWLDEYLRQRPEKQDRAVMAALQRALFSYRHPIIGPPARIAGKVLRRLGVA